MSPFAINGQSLSYGQLSSIRNSKCMMYYLLQCLIKRNHKKTIPVIISQQSSRQYFIHITSAENYAENRRTTGQSIFNFIPTSFMYTDVGSKPSIVLPQHLRLNVPYVHLFGVRIV